MAYPCDKCFHNFNCSLASVAACNCCEDGDWFESVRDTETEEEGEEPPPFSASRHPARREEFTK